MNEVIAGIRVIKMYAWEYPLKRVLSKIRRYVLIRNYYILCSLLHMYFTVYNYNNLPRKESRLILYSGMIRGGVYGFVAVSSTVLGYFVFITLVATEGPKSLVFDNLFITISLLITLRLYVVECSVLCLQGGAEALVALSRIQVYNYDLELISVQL